MRDTRDSRPDMSSVTYQNWLVNEVGGKHRYRLPLDVITRSRLEKKYFEGYGRLAIDDYRNLLSNL